MSDGVIITLSALSIPIIAILCEHLKDMREIKLREKEMERGFPPGTYSKLSKKDRKRAKEQANEVFEQAKMKKEETKEELLKGINDLMQRINNIETIKKGTSEK